MTTLPGPVSDDDLPRIPLPEVHRSAELFLQWCAPLVTADEFAETRRAADELLADDSRVWAWQEELRAFDQNPENASWLDEFWRTRYLGRRDRIALNANFFFLFPPAPLGQAQRAAELVAAAVDLHLAIDDGTYEYPTARGRAMSSEQFKYLFSSTRIPGDEIDTSRSPYTDDWPGSSDARHIVVLRRGHAYRVDVLDPHRRPYSAAALTDVLDALLADGTDPADHPVGSLTTMPRAEWAAVRRELLVDNAQSIEVIETALFGLCLDDVTPQDVQASCDQLLHGGHGNRWYDKSVSLVVLADGTAGLNGEHCNLDGTTMVSMIETILDREAREAVRRAASDSVPEPATRIGFVLDDSLRTSVTRAGKRFRRFADGTASMLVSFDVGSSAAKQRRASPDSVVQQCIQLARHRATDEVGATYESIAMRTYRHGRTEAMRVVTPQSARFVEVMADADSDTATRLAALREALDAHVQRARECQAGDAPEQHLWELDLIGRRRDEAPLAFYDSPGWQIARADRLSTSSVPSVQLDWFGFGSTSPTCIGVGYVLLEDSLHCYLSTPVEVADVMERFADELRRAVPDILDLLDQDHPEPAAQESSG